MSILIEKLLTILNQEYSKNNARLKYRSHLKKIKPVQNINK
jgi:hypothetical protein